MKRKASATSAIRPQATVPERELLQRKLSLVYELVARSHGEPQDPPRFEDYEDGYHHSRGLFSPLLTCADPTAESGLPFCEDPRVCLRSQDLLPVLEGLTWTDREARRGTIQWPGGILTTYFLKPAYAAWMERGGWVALVRADHPEETKRCGPENREELIRVLSEGEELRMICPMPRCSAFVDILFLPSECTENFFCCADCLPAAERRHAYPVPSRVTPNVLKVKVARSTATASTRKAAFRVVASSPSLEVS